MYPDFIGTGHVKNVESIEEITFQNLFTVRLKMKDYNKAEEFFDNNAEEWANKKNWKLNMLKMDIIVV